MNEITQDEVQRRIDGLPDDTQRAMVCAMVGHSRVVNYGFWRYYCARCGEEVADALLAPAPLDVVIVGHGCDECRAHAENLTWRDTFMAPDPFAPEATPEE